MGPPLSGEELVVRAYIAAPRGVPIPQTTEARIEGLGVSAAVWDGAKNVPPPPPPGVSLTHKPPRQDRRDSGVSAIAYRELEIRSYMPPTGRPYPPNNAGRTRGSGVIPPLCGQGPRNDDT